jgi:DoxX-like family
LMTAPSPVLIRSCIAAVWLYEGLWCKVLGRMPSQLQVVSAVPRLGISFGPAFLKTLGVVEMLIAAWAFSGIAPVSCAVTQVVLLVALNVNGLLWARHLIHDPAGMVVKNLAFLILVWISGTLPPR